MDKPGRLQVTARGDREIVMTRDLDAPRTLVFDAFTKPELIRRWMLGPDGWSMPVCEVDLRVGGAIRYVWRKEDQDAGQEGCGPATEMGMSGVIREVEPPERLVSTEVWDNPWFPGEAVGTILLVERDGKTTVTQTIVYQSPEARDAVLKSGMETGVAAGYDRLEQLLAAQQAA